MCYTSNMETIHTAAISDDEGTTTILLARTPEALQAKVREFLTQLDWDGWEREEWTAACDEYLENDTNGGLRIDVGTANL